MKDLNESLQEMLDEIIFGKSNEPTIKSSWAISLWWIAVVGIIAVSWIGIIIGLLSLVAKMEK